MNREYFLILPNIFLQDSCQIGILRLQRFGGENKYNGDKINEELLTNIQITLFNTGFSGLFTYSNFNSGEKFEDVVLYVRKAMTVLRYAIFEEHPNFSLELLTYFLVHPRKFADNITEMKYSLEGIQDGNQHVHLFSPGFREIIRTASYPDIVALASTHYLIRKFNENALDGKYIIAIERFNRTFKNNNDPVEDILNLATAFEHIYKLKDGNKAELLAKNLVQEFGLQDMPLAKTFGDWSEQFYVARGQITHGNAFEFYKKEKGFDYWEECFKWKHPNGTIRYIPHAFIASRIFQLLIKRLLGGRKILEIEQLEKMLTESEIEPLITPNEVYYNELIRLVNTGSCFGEPFYNIIQKIKQCDGTENKAVLFKLLPFFMNVIIIRFPELEKECENIISLTKQNDIPSISLSVFELSQKIMRKITEPLIISNETMLPLWLGRLLEKIYHQLTNIALHEMSAR